MMRQTSLILSILIFTLLKAWPQTQQLAQVKGSVLDLDSKTGLFNASVVLLYDNNATIAGSTFTKQSGNFLLDSLQPGKYTLRISYLGYQTVTQSITIPIYGYIINQDSILMQRTGITLQTLEILATLPSISIKKDTLEFNADNFKTRKNAVIEELLQKLPGIQIEKDGTIKVNGETIKRILIDGRQFFGPETKLATQNLPAEMIEKLQVLDWMPDGGRLTRGNNQEKETVINITIKKNWMSNLFGQASTAVGTNDCYAWNANFNRFKNNEQLSLLSLGHNMNSLDFLTTGAPNPRLTGIISNLQSGINYNKDIGKKIKLSASYLLTDKGSQNEYRSVRETFLRDSSNFYNQNVTIENNTRGNSFIGRLEYKIDTLRYTMMDISLNQFYGENLSKSLYESIGNNGQLLNSGNLYNSSSSNDISLSGIATFQQKFNKRNRSLRISLVTNYTNSIQNGFNRSHNTFILQDGASTTDSIDQCYNIYTSNKMIRLSSMYTEPLFKDHFLDITYVLTSKNGSSEKITYNYVKSTGGYTHLDTDLSNRFKNISSFHSVNLTLRAQKNKYDYGIGLDMTSYSITNENITHPEKLRRQNFILLPSVYFNHILRNNDRVNITYAGVPELPEISQLQPVFNNNNPIYIQQGNPDLRMGLAHNFGLSYTAINPANQHYLATNVSISLSRNKIIYANNFDSLGRQISYPINVNGTYSITGLVTNAFPIKNSNITINTNTIFEIGRNVNFINNVKGDIRNYVLTQELSFSFINSEVFELNFIGSVNYNNVNYSVQKNNNAEYSNYTAHLRYNINFPLGFILSSNLAYTLQSGRAEPYNRNVLILNAAISKSILRDKQANLKFHGLDLLNQNTSITRNIGENYIEDVNNNMLQRIFLLSISYYLKPNRNK